ncbi:MAG: DUF58 domain-containing protein [Planctomycetes bacterium]|nr:DUF58 domain-containing protein [Planctomycetota bacterium]
MSNTQYLKPEVIRQIARLDLKAKFIVEGFISGLHQSPYHGFSVEFSEHRRYNSGDDLKDIDWNVLAKTDKLYIKKFQAETNLNCYLVVDTSASMRYGSGDHMNKLEYATCLAASIGYLMISQQDAVGLITFDERVRMYLPPRSKRSQLPNILGELARPSEAKKTDVPRVLMETAGLIRDRGLVILFSDLLGDVEPILSGLHRLRFGGHEVIVFHILDEAEAKFPFDGPTRFEDVESPEFVHADAASIREEYLRQIKDFVETYTTECFNAQIDYIQIDTSVPFDKALTSYLIKRKSRF